MFALFYSDGEQGWGCGVHGGAFASGLGRWRDFDWQLNEHVKMRNEHMCLSFSRWEQLSYLSVFYRVDLVFAFNSRFLNRWDAQSRGLIKPGLSHSKNFQFTIGKSQNLVESRMYECALRKGEGRRVLSPTRVYTGSSAPKGYFTITSTGVKKVLCHIKGSVV